MGCHLNTCPVGVTSQKEALRKKFPGTPEHVVNFFEFVAEELRELMAHLGYSKFEDLIGRADLLKEDEDQFSKVAKTKGISLSGFFSSIPDSKEERAFLRTTPAEGGGHKNDVVHINGFSSDLDREICNHPDVKAAIENNEGDTAVSFNIKNTDRSTCPVGVTSQKEALRKKFPGTPEHVVNFFEFVAEELRELMAHLGYSKFEDLIGRADLLKEDEDQFSKVAKTKGISLSGFFSSIPDSKEERAFLRTTPAEGGGHKNDVVHINGFSSDLDREICNHPD